MPRRCRLRAALHLHSHMDSLVYTISAPLRGMAKQRQCAASADDLVTVVIPTYNRYEQVCGAIDTALAQTYRNVEIVVVDDCSTDGTAELLRERYGSRISLMVRSDNGGAAAARNTGIRTARGRWIRCLDSDDEMAPTAIAELVDAASKSDNPERCLFFSECWVVYDCDRRRMPTASSAYNGADPITATAGAVWGTSLLFVARSAFEEHGYFREDLRYSEDLEWILRLLLLHGFAFHTVDKLLLNYRQHEGSTTGTALKEVLASKERVLAEMAAKVGAGRGDRLLQEFGRVDERQAPPGRAGRAKMRADAIIKCKMPRLYLLYHGIGDGFAR